jgi:hypothetical protein
MMSGMTLETCWAFKKRLNNKFYYKVAYCWLFLLIQIFEFLAEISSDFKADSIFEYKCVVTKGIT